MTSATVGYYVHHQGAGHATRFSNIAAASGVALTPISELPLPGGVRLPADVVPDGSDPTAGGALHWAPIGHEQSARRSLVFGQWLCDVQPRGVVVDVSVEAALLCRLFGIATIVVRQHGDRTDPAHEMAYRSARAILAPFPAALEHVATPEWVTSRTTYTGFVSRAARGTNQGSGRVSTDTPAYDDVVILWGAGGGALTPHDIEAIARASGPSQVWFVGTEPFDVRPMGVRALGWIADVSDVLSNSPTVIASAGNNVVADAAAAGCALVVVPQPRPFDEQLRHADSLNAVRAAAVVEPEGTRDWRTALEAARDRRPALADLAAGGDGAVAAAELIARAFR